MTSPQRLLHSRQTLTHILHDGVHLAGSESDALQMAQWLAAAGLVQLSALDYVHCVSHDDDDYLEVLESSCTGKIQVGSEPLICPECGRQLEYPGLYKQQFHETVVNLRPVGIADYVFDLFAQTRGINTVIRMGPLAGHLVTGDGRPIDVTVAVTATPGASTPGPHSEPARLIVTVGASGGSARAGGTVDLVDLLTEDERWREQQLHRVQPSASSAPGPRRGRGDLLDIRVGGLQGECYPVEFVINGLRHFQDKTSGPIPHAPIDTLSESLFRWLCGSPSLLAAWKIACEGDTPLRIRLRLDAPELFALAWESMVAPIGDAMIAVAAADATAFSRYLAFSGRPRAAIDRRPIRILAAIAAPEGLTQSAITPIDTGEEWENLRTSLRYPDAVLEQLQCPCTLANIESQLRQGANVLHLVAHGASNGHRTGILLEDDGRLPVIVEGKEFAAMVGRVVSGAASTLRLIFLDSCHSATAVDGDPLHSTAVEMVRVGAPAVVAMQGMIEVPTGRAFAAAFYRNLLRHGVVDLAANQARSALLSQQRNGAALPVLYMRLPDGALFEPGS